MTPIARILSAGAVFGALAFGTAALADIAPPIQAAAPTPPKATAAPDVYRDYRHNEMEAMGKHMKLLYMITSGKAPFPAHAVSHAEALHALTTHIPDMFPAGTGPDKVKSDSKAEIWKDWGRFLDLSKAAEAETAKLVEVAKAGDAAKLGEQFQATRKACGNCHDVFKVEDEH